MKPYIGILIDSFWEAVGNKVLWALLIGWSILLLCLAPFGYVGENSYLLTSYDIDDRNALVSKLSDAARGKGSEAGQIIVSKLKADFVAKLKAADKDDSQFSIRRSDLAEALNEAVKANGLYQEEAFPTATRRKELKALIDRGQENLAEDELQLLNRHLIRLAYPLEVGTPQGEQVWLGYAGFKIGSPLPFSRQRIGEYFEPVVLQVIIKFGLAVLAVLIAIIVTSPIIPDTFRSGSLHLLLSKPISRVWLYLSKFFGGTIFVLVNIAFVLVGLYLIAGLRFGVWNNGLLLCIPILLFVFVIFYSVSGLAGLVWGNAIVCVVACMLFWFCCWILGFSKAVIQPHVEIFPQVSTILPVGDEITVVNEKGDYSVWNEKFSVWRPAVSGQMGGPNRTFGPIYDEQRSQIYVKSFFSNPFGGSRGRSRELQVIDIENDGAIQPSQDAVVEAERPAEKAESAASESQDDDAAGGKGADARGEVDAEASGSLPSVSEKSAASDEDEPRSAKEARDQPLWQADPGPAIPQQLFALLEVRDQVIAVCRGGLFRMDAKQIDMIEQSEKALFGIKLPWMRNNAFQNIAPADYFLSENSNAAVTQDGDGLIIFSSGRLDYLRLLDDKFVIEATMEFEDEDVDKTAATAVQMNAEFCVVASDGAALKILNSKLEPLNEVELPNDEEVKKMAWIPDSSQLAVVTHTGNVWQIDCKSAKIQPLGLPYSGSITTMAWVDANRVWLGVEPNEVYLVDAKQGSIEKSLTPANTTLENVYFYGLSPAYTVLPKPAALDDAMTYFLSNNKTQDLNVMTSDLSKAQLELDIWTPILSNMAFVVCILAVSCIYVARKEF